MGSAAGRPIRAVLFDLDGTLYRQQPLRRWMMWSLLRQAVRHPLDAPRLWRVVSRFRAAQEQLRSRGHCPGLAEAQIATAARETGVEPKAVRTIVEEWMQVRPLAYLERCRTPGVLEVLDDLAAAGVPAAVLSDYPAASKLTALGIAHRIAWSICSTDRDVEAFKPHPRGFLRACERFGLPPAEVLMVGDRVDADAAGAAAAGMPCVILSRQRHAPSSSWVSVSTFEGLHRVLHDRR